ncbi:MAG TPA: SusC/RagA family TonB-linked outer membrane protein [Bacteroidales bacterium]|jgi:TonB-linked SusC/RagA family outer membrane protein|nr:SusC/RagA family TonB-linked outer membrane protein [Bacteroidales bacterium]MBP7874321.1 SusC/RagA family TonB-linked outer membrane protein [Bacteroidales bacterium]MCZ2282284.1 SusC/RagA family TonB-linked outer membrane protein [Bacteroidales bacterium]HPX34026.1 SusC/RagA family TonB-linked outer membrane protein [Bacteroidales bacterium]
MRLKLFTLFTFLLINVFGFAQQKSVSGKVYSDQDDIPLIGVTVLIKGTLTGTVTDVNGRFTLPSVEASTILVFSYIGFETVEIFVGEQQFIEIRMLTKYAEVEEVVVTALGVSRQKREIGYSTEKIDEDVLIESRAPNILNAISGRSAGVQISQPDGIEGGSTRIVIRGNNNIGADNQPLIVVDNVPMENVPGLSNIGRGVDWGSAINDINAFDIESMTLMKGGAASALYGSRGANGVLFITTKRGQKQKGIGVTYNMDYRITHPYRYREVQNIYGHGGPISLTPPVFPTSGDTLLYPGIYDNAQLVINQEGKTSTTAEEFGYYGSSVSWGPKMEGQMIKWWDGKMRPYSPQPDNLKIPFSDGYTTTHNISATGGGDKGTMRVSITRQDNKPIIENSEFNRTTLNLGATLDISSKLKTDLTLSFINYHRLNSPMLGEDWNSFSKGLLYSWPRSYQAVDKMNYANPDGTQNPQDGYPFLYLSKTIWWDYYNNNTTLDRDKYTAALTLIYDMTSWLQVLGRIGRDFTIEQYETRNKPIDALGLQNGYYSNNLARNVGDNYDFTMTAKKDEILDSKLDLTFSMGTSRYNTENYYIGGRSGTWYYPNMYTFFNYTDNIYSTDANNNTIVEQFGNTPGSMAPSEQIIRKRINSVYSFLNLAYDSYLFLELTGRNDWSSTLPKGNNSYFYPSVSLSFIASEVIDFQKHINWLNFMKIRGGIAQTATDTDPYLMTFHYNTTLFGGQQASNFPATIPPLNLKPQRVNSYEGGLNLGFFDNRIDMDFTYYYLYSFDQIIPNLPLPFSSGATTIMTNEGVLTNKGIELIINTVPVRTKDWLVRSGINIARNRNKVVSLGGSADSYMLADIWGLNGPAMILHEGDSYGTISGYDYIFDENGNRVVNEEGTKYLITDTRVPIGNAAPHFIGGWNTMAAYKGFKFTMLIDTKWGGDIYCGSYVIGLQTGQSPETLKEREGDGLPYTDPDGNTSNIGIILDGVHEDGTPNTTVVHYYYKYLPNAGGWGKFVSTPGILENTWVKMRELSLAYTIPQKWLEKLKAFQNLTVSFTARDLFYIYTTLPDKINPEGIMGSGNAQGFEWASFPGTRSFVFGLTASF